MTRLEKVIQCEMKSLERFQLLPHSLKKVAFVFGLLSLTSLIFLVFADTEYVFLKSLSQNGILLSMLLISITKEKTEDEYTIFLRGKSYAMAFVIGILYAIFQPYINFGVEAIIDPGDLQFRELQPFGILWFMLFIQLCFYYSWRRMR